MHAVDCIIFADYDDDFSFPTQVGRAKDAQTARLFAAAPQMLEALRLARHELIEYAEADVFEQSEGAGVYVRPWDHIGPTLDAIDAAIAATQEATR